MKETNIEIKLHEFNRDEENPVSVLATGTISANIDGINLNRVLFAARNEETKEISYEVIPNSEDEYGSISDVIRLLSSDEEMVAAIKEKIDEAYEDELATYDLNMPLEEHLGEEFGVL